MSDDNWERDIDGNDHLVFAPFKITMQHHANRRCSFWIEWRDQGPTVPPFWTIHVYQIETVALAKDLAMQLLAMAVHTHAISGYVVYDLPR